MYSLKWQRTHICLFQKLSELVNSDISLRKCQSFFFWDIWNNIVKILWKTFINLEWKWTYIFSFQTFRGKLKYLKTETIYMSPTYEGRQVSYLGNKGCLYLREGESNFCGRDVSYLSGVYVSYLLMADVFNLGRTFKGRRHSKGRRCIHPKVWDI